MSHVAEMGVELPETGATIKKALEGERRKLNSWAAALVRDIEARRDLGLRRLDQAESALAVEVDKGTGPGRATAKRPRTRRGPTPSAQAAQRREAILRYLTEQGRPKALSEIRAALRLPEFSTRSALRRLVEEDKVVCTGTGAATRYAAKADGPGSLAALPQSGPDRGTRQGRIIELIEDRGSASADELAQALRVSREEVAATCGILVREEEIRMASRDGRPVYIPGQVAA